MDEHVVSGFIGGFVSGFVSVLLIFALLNEQGWFDNPRLYKKQV